MGYQDPTKRNEYMREYYQAHKAKHIAVVRAYKAQLRKENQQRISEYLIGKSCIDCGESDPVVFEFDHVRGTKHKAISRLRCNASWDTILVELAKCDIRCANCHRRRHNGTPDRT